jgi:hypothetical protein
MSEKSWTLRGVDEQTRSHVVAEAALRGVSVAEYLNELLLERAVLDELASAPAAEEPVGAAPIVAPPIGETPNFAMRHRVEALERRMGLSVGGLDSAIHALDSSVFGLAARMDETEALAGETAQTLDQSLHDLSGNLAALRKRLSDAEDVAEAQAEAADAAYQATAERFERAEHHLSEVDAIARGAATTGAALTSAHEALQETLARDFNAFARQVDARFVAGYADMSAAAESAVRHADDAVNHALEHLRALNQSVEERLAESAADTRARMQAAFGDAAERLASLAERVIDNERFTLRTTDQLRAQIADVEDAAQTALEETAEQLRQQHAALVAETERQYDNTRLAIEGARMGLGQELQAMRNDLDGEIGEVRERQLGALARLKLVDAAVTNTIGDVTELREALDRRVGEAGAEVREAIAGALGAWNVRFDSLANRPEQTTEDLAHARHVLAAETNRVEACTLAALEKLASDIAAGDQGIRQTLGAELADLRDQASGALARLTLIDRALGARELIAATDAEGVTLADRLMRLEALAGASTETDGRIAQLEDALASAASEQSLITLAAQVKMLAEQLEAQRVDENIQQRIDDLRARLAAQESSASEAADRVHGVARMLGRVTAQSADSATQSEERLHKLELALADMRLEHISSPQGAAPNAAQAEAIAAVAARVAQMEQRQLDAFESIRADIAHFIGENDRRLASLEQHGPAAVLDDLNMMLEARLTAIEARDVAGEFEALRKRIDERILYVEQRSVRALEQVSETVAVIEKRMLGGDRGVAKTG